MLLQKAWNAVQGYRVCRRQVQLNLERFALSTAFIFHAAARLYYTFVYIGFGV